MTRMDHSNCKLSIWDVGGQETLRVQWRHHYAATDAVVFVVDASDDTRMDTAKKHLHDIVQEQALQFTPVLVLANKIDLPEALPLEEIYKLLDIAVLGSRQHECELLATCASSGEGVDSAVAWILEHAQDPEFDEE